MKKRKLCVKPKFIALLCFLILGGLVFVLHSQQNKLNDIKQEQEQLLEVLHELKVEEQRTEHLIEYAKTEEYMIRYAREKLGYVMPDDYLFVTGN